MAAIPGGLGDAQGSLNPCHVKVKTQDFAYLIELGSLNGHRSGKAQSRNRNCSNQAITPVDLRQASMSDMGIYR